MIFTVADYIIVVILILSILISIIRGFVKEAVSLTTWIAAFWLAFHLVTQLTPLLQNYVHTPSVRYIVAFLIIFVVVLILGNIVGFIISKMIDATGLSSTDRFLGSFFGMARGVLLISILLLLASYTPVTKDAWWQQSMLIPHFKLVQIWLKDMLPISVGNRFEINNNN